MAKSTGMLESDPTMMAKVTELKKELQRLVKAIVDEDESSVEIYDQAKEALLMLKALNSKKSLTSKLDTIDIPQHFLCPISKEIMKDPVIVSTGQTYDRRFIERWFDSGSRTCPRTQQVLSHIELTPNDVVRDMISHWCKSNGIELPNPVQNTHLEGITKGDKEHLNSLLEILVFSSVTEQKEAAKELRRLTKRMPSFRAIFGEYPNSIRRLLSPLTLGKADSHPNLQEDLITTLLNLSIHDDNKKLVVDTPTAIPLLIESLKTGTIESRSNAAAAFFSLSALDTNKVIIGRSGVFKPLIDLLEEGHPLAMKDVASAIFNLCINHENKAKAVNDGLVKVVLNKIMDHKLVDELLTILAMLSSHQRAIDDMCEYGAVPCLLSIIRESNCDRNKENCAVMLYSICLNNRSKLREMREEENVNRTISHLAQNGTSRAKRKANGILERLNRSAMMTHTA